ncbi:SpoIIE family protein phosphatase [Pontiella sp.]|uniref:SpoIIE family protein phosphatase n=1 Tax=Pontiella sp. TaxID=2837462 RepID=UPI003564D478
MSKIPDNTDLLQQLMDNIEDNIFFKDRDGKFIMINKANAKWFGVEDPREVVGKDDFDFFDAKHAQQQIEEERWIMKTGKPVLGEAQASSHGGHVGWGSVTKIPLRDNDGRIIGTMGIGRDISELMNKELELKKAHAQIVEDLRLAAKLQQTFLPQSYPSFLNADNRPLIQFHHYYEADVDLGGDFCSIYRLSNTKAGLLICDVMGHGVRAALVTGIIHAFAEELVQQADSPGNFLTALNQRLVPVLQTEEEYLFATAAYCSIDLESGELALALAGHTLPFLIQPQVGQVSQLTMAEEILGPALAIVADNSYESTRVQLNPGDEVLMYTDGICEALNTSRDEFGVENLQETIQDYNKLPLKELIPRIIKVVQDFAGSKKLGDDICLLGFTLNALRAAESE